MPTNRILYTMRDVKTLIAEREGVEVELVNTFECCEILIDCHGGQIGVEEETYLFQTDK